MSRIEELEKQAKSILEEIEKLKKEENVESKKVSKVWKPEFDEDYYVIEVDGEVREYTWYDEGCDEKCYAIGNCFKTREEVEKAVEKAKIYTQLKRLAEENNTEPIDWENEDQNKYYLGYECYPDAHGLGQAYDNTFKVAGIIYCTNKNFLEIAKQHIGEEDLLKLFKE